MVSDNQQPATDQYDVVILGGAFSGSALGTLLKWEKPDARILIVEKCTEFDRKVGESTSEVAGYFLSKTLGLSNYLSSHHYQKHGLRMWFNSPGNDCPDCCAEIGPIAQSRLTTYQLDRSLLDEHLLQTAVEAGCELLRPATVKNLDLAGAGNNTVTVKTGDTTRTIRADWVADCSGRAALIARQRKTFHKLDAHPVHSMWVRFRNVRDLDCHEAITAAPSLAEGTWTSRGTATNHLMGRGWWCWLIPLPNGDFSAGITWDERHFSPPSDGPIGERILQHLRSQPIGKLMFENAEAVENDARIYKHLPYYTTKTADDGWMIIGDAAGFMDPLYSQGLDYCSLAIHCSKTILLKALRGECVADDIAAHDKDYLLSYQRWFDGIYRDKYEYLGDADLMRCAFLLDVASYFVGPVRDVYQSPHGTLAKMPYNGTAGAIFARFMAWYNRRLVKLARKRIAHGTYGKNNATADHIITRPFLPNLTAFRHVFAGIGHWWKLEIRHAFVRIPQGDPSSADPNPKEAVAS
jgi:flavin-dependent dehydrogenase